MTLHLLPIFPLPLVLFPRATVPLHIFEPRYRNLLADCLAGDREFGIVCLPEGAAASEIPAGTAGCVAHIESARALPDGRSDIVVTGRHRFTLERFVPDPASYHVGQVSTLSDEPEPAAVLAALATGVRSLFERVGRASRAIANELMPLPELPDEPAELSFAVARRLDLDLGRQQELLASRSSLERLQRLDGILAAVVDEMEERARVHALARTNGHGPRAGAT